MKKLVVVLLLLGFITPLFADDALMIPQNVIRFRVIPSATFSSQEFNDDGDRVDYEAAPDVKAFDSLHIYSLSFALEYGVTDWVTAALQWTPGWQFASSLQEPLDNPAIENQKFTGLNDLFIGAKAQIVGPNAPVPNEQHRFAFALGAIAPLSTYDAEDEAENAAGGDEYRRRRVGNDVWGAGARLYYDFVVNPSFFVNLYNESIFYFPRELEQIDHPTTAREYDYGYKLTFELEPQYQTMLSDGLRFGAGLPVTYITTPKTKVEGDEQDETDTYKLRIGPNVSFFFLDAPWPIDLELAFQTDIVGKNTPVQNSVVLQIKNYLRFW